MKSKVSRNNMSKDWSKVRLGSIADFKKGKGLPKSDLCADGQHEAIHYGELFTKYNEKITRILSKTNKIEGAFLSKKNDILMPTSDVTPRGLSTASYLDKEGVVLGGDILIIRAKETQLNGLFFSYFVRSQKQEIIKLVSGTTVFHLYGSDLAKLAFNLPPLPEQNRIVAVLETWDKAIELLKKKIEIKKEVKQGLMQLLLSGKIRLKGFTEKWETVELGNISNFVNGYTFKSSTYVDDGMYKIITIANVQDGHLLMDKPRQINELPSNISREQILSKGDILISMTGNVGRVCTVDQDGGLLNQRVGKIIPRGINRDLFYLFLHDRRFLKTMIDSAQGGAQGNLSTSDIKLYRFDIPTSMKEQDMLADILTASNKEIQVLESKQKVMQEQKTYLLNNLITGQIRTPENLKIFS